MNRHEEEMSRLGHQLLEMLRLRQEAELDRRYTEVLELELAIEPVHQALAEAAERLRSGG
jgi:hypothetical protein